MAAEMLAAQKSMQALVPIIVSVSYRVENGYHLSYHIGYEIGLKYCIGIISGGKLVSSIVSYQTEN